LPDGVNPAMLPLAWNLKVCQRNLLKKPDGRNSISRDIEREQAGRQPAGRKKRKTAVAAATNY